MEQRMDGTEARQCIRLEPVPAGWANGFVVGADQGPAFRGSGDGDYVCGQCGRVLVAGVRPGVFGGVMFRCGCGMLNRVPRDE